MTANNIQYLYNQKTGIELILCESSTISYPLHNHISVLTIGIILDGSIVLTTNQGAKTYTKNQTYIILPYAPHSIATSSSYTLLSLCIDKNIVMNSTTDTIRNNIVNLLTDALSIEKIIKYKYSIIQSLNCLNTISDYSNWHSAGKNMFIQDLKYQLELYPERKISIDEMAQKAFISKYHFIRSFKEEVGLTPHQFQIQNRIRKAQRLIHEKETITEAALSTGFCDQSHFIKHFEKYVGLPPLIYKLSSDTVT